MVYLRACVPFFVIALFVLLDLVYLGRFFGGGMRPQFFIAALFYWITFRPHFMPHIVIFSIGILQDIFHGFPMGLHALTYLVIGQIILSQRRFLTAQTFPVFWAMFGLVILLQAGVKSVLFITFTPVSPDWLSIAISSGLTFIMFPLLMMILNLSHKTLSESYAKDFHD